MVQTRSGRKTEEVDIDRISEASAPRKRKGAKETEKRQPKKKVPKKEEKNKEEPEAETKEEEPEVETKEEHPKPEPKDTSAAQTKTGGRHHEAEPEILEKGLIYFFYKPKVELKEAHGPEDVQRLYLLLWPAAPPVQEDEKQMTHHEGKMGKGEPERLIVLGRKKLPDVHGKHERFWGFVEKVSRSLEEVEEDLEARTYTTRTRGERHVEGARPVGEGVYALVKHGDHIHLELPEELTEIQKAFNIAKEGSYVVTVKNPDLAGEVHYPEHVKKLFLSEKTGRPLKFAPARPELLDYEGAEVLFISAADGIEDCNDISLQASDLKTEFGETGEYIEELEHVDARRIQSDKLWKELHLSRAEHPAEPLLRGKWK